MNDKKLFDLSGRVALVTGCNKGLGQGMALALADAGARIVALTRTRPDETLALLAGRGTPALHLQTDFGDIAGFDGLVAQAAAHFGRVDILVNNAGTIRRAEALEFSERDWDEVVDLNLKSVFFLSQAVARRLVAQGGGGKIVNIASMLSYQGGVRVPSYTASKSGVLGLTRELANEWAPHGINVNAIAPGYMATDNTEALRADARRNEAILERIPAGRWGRPEDLAGPVVFLASAAADYVHGFTLAVDGGWLAR
ncbi:2-dehydro-3-deoxy-D-gluconate 5-dehydrogenase KduD [Azohydromonas caseinilytica]|uniref:2-dehydro-3-deoxy-D-gluconate 5-dehydrogenase n=1 Tax=Azohydromonas caseinilytica TaxID=2728836 RepID=A0A848FIP3_9BURK|nr:2-dehydro-3-deoxy-D-gluconate 5-dehydrogenase KduD [Azohydromonas caseinilytica]NML18765.1 2-dehydro-3-deoxy-D-gluconate 5-dehydrogenase KduD [Azohydromonas caseinilytica]